MLPDEASAPGDRCRQRDRSHLEGAVHGEYLTKARHIDRQYCGAQPGVPGPVEGKLRTYGAVRGLVFGSWGDASTKVKPLASAAVGRGNAATSEGGGTEANASSGSWLKPRWGLTAARASARLLLDRLTSAGGGACAAALRRADARQRFDAARRCSLNARPRLWRWRRLDT